MDLKDKTVLITGGASGIGLACAKRITEHGGKTILFDTNRRALDAAATQIKSSLAVRCDVSQIRSVETCVNEAFKAGGPIDILINSAGIMRNAPLVNLLNRDDPKHCPQLWKEVIDTNLSSVFYVTSCVAAGMVARRTKGLIINMSSISAHGNAGQTAYSASKAGINAMTVTWAKELSPFGIRCNALAPGFINTAATEDALEKERLRTWVGQTPLKRMGTVEEIVDAVLFVVENDFYNGQILEINGGLRL